MQPIGNECDATTKRPPSVCWWEVLRRFPVVAVSLASFLNNEITEYRIFETKWGLWKGAAAAGVEAGRLIHGSSSNALSRKAMRWTTCMGAGSKAFFVVPQKRGILGPARNGTYKTIHTRRCSVGGHSCSTDDAR